MTPVDDPLAEIAGPPTTLVLDDEPDGPWPGPPDWEFYTLSHDGLGAVAVVAEAAPASFFSVSSGRGLWGYAQTPPLPAGGVPFTEQGLAASPPGHLEGRNVRLAGIFRSPINLVDEMADEFVYEIILGVRFLAPNFSYVGARVRAEWVAGVWTTPIAVEAVSAAGAVPSVLASAPLPGLADPLDFWRNYTSVDLEAVVRGAVLDVNLSDVRLTTAGVASSGPSKPFIQVRCYNRTGSTFVSVPVIEAFQFQSLRDLEALGPPPKLPGDQDLEAIGVLPAIRAPLQELLDQGFVKRVGARRFEALLDFDAEVFDQTWTIKQGELLHSREEFVGQLFVAVSRDLAHERGRSGL